jgi:hypothetical protein
MQDASLESNNLKAWHKYKTAACTVHRLKSAYAWTTASSRAYQNLKHLSYSETSFVASNWHMDYVHKTLAAELQQKWK